MEDPGNHTNFHEGAWKTRGGGGNIGQADVSGHSLIHAEVTVSGNCASAGAGLKSKGVSVVKLHAVEGEAPELFSGAIHERTKPAIAEHILIRVNRGGAPNQAGHRLRAAMSALQIGQSQSDYVSVAQKLV